MRIGVLGTGMVGKAIASRLSELGHDVQIGSRTAGKEGAVPFADAAAFGEVLFNCTAGNASIAALQAAGEANLAGKTLIDTSNPLDHSGGGMPTLFVSNTDSLGEQIQRAFPEVHVVKTLQTMNCEVMVNPALVPGDHVVFVCGDDAGAKQQTTELLGEFGWPAERVLDLGDISAARGTEMYVALWLRIWQAVGALQFNIAVAR
jgi:8-hydroxy-5-deazaflavin:NADPH oxidoreductase